MLKNLLEKEQNKKYKNIYLLNIIIMRDIENTVYESYKENIDDELLKKKTPKEILNKWKEITTINDEPHIYDFIVEYLDYLKNKKKPKSKPISVKKMAKETKQLSKKIMNENEELNKARKEIKYMGVRPKKEKVLKINVNFVTDKTGKNLQIETEFFTDQFTNKMIGDIVNDITRKAREVIKQRKREGRMMGGAINFDSESDGDS